MADAEKERRDAAAGRERLITKIAAAESTARRADAAAKDASVHISPSPKPDPLPAGRDAAAYDAAAKDADKMKAAAESNLRKTLANPRIREPDAPRHDPAASGANKQPSVSFRDREEALAFSDGRVHAMRRPDGNEYDPKDVIIVENQNGEALIYVRPDWQDYGKVARQIHGRKLSADGLDADHIASRKVEGGVNQRYVLLGRVPAKVNRAHGGAVERVGARLNRPFNLASRGDGVSLSNHDMDAKMAGLTPAEARASEAKIDPNSEAARHSRFADPQSQATIRAAKGRSLAAPEQALPARERRDTAIEQRTKASDRGRERGKE